MIYTVTLNPSIDYVVYLPKFHEGDVNRTSKDEYLVGGKGINVSVVLNNLGMESVCLGFIAGYTGKEIERLVKESGCSSQFITVKEGISRINIKMKHGQETEINGQGPNIGEEEVRLLLEQVNHLNNGDILVLAGSIPSSLPITIYKEIMEIVKEKEVLCIVDTTKDLLRGVLQYRPFLIKPNHYELSEIFGVTIESRSEIIEYGKKLQQLGARNVFVSRASKGAILLTEGGRVIETMAPSGTVVNSVGAGDSMIAGFLASYLSHSDYERAVKYAVATGSASAFSSALATKDSVEALVKQLETRKTIRKNE